PRSSRRLAHDRASRRFRLLESLPMPAPLLRRLGLPIALALLAACGATAEPVELAAADAARPAVVDSILPIEEALRRFRDGLDAPDSLRGGHTDRDSLVAAFGSALF